MYPDALCIRNETDHAHRPFPTLVTSPDHLALAAASDRIHHPSHHRSRTGARRDPGISVVPVRSSSRPAGVCQFPGFLVELVRDGGADWADVGGIPAHAIRRSSPFYGYRRWLRVGNGPSVLVTGIRRGYNSHRWLLELAATPLTGERFPKTIEFRELVRMGFGRPARYGGL